MENPGTESVESLIKNVHDGEYVIPYFQRSFQWDPSLVCDLFESILQDYFAGLILLWDLDNEEVINEKWDPIWGAELKGTPDKAVLDGQQRLSSLYYAIYNPKKRFPSRRSYYIFYINLNKVLNDDFEGSVTYKYYSNHRNYDYFIKRIDDFAKNGVIPISMISPEKRFIDSDGFVKWINLYIENNKKELPNNIASLKVYKVMNDILGYEFVYFPLSMERDLVDICNIFTRVNVKGMKLSTFDIMNAFIYPKGVSLRRDLWDNLDNEILKNIDTNMNEYLLKLISLNKQDYCSTKYIYNLVPGNETIQKDKYGKKKEVVLVEDGDEFIHLWNKSCNYAEKARRIIMNTGINHFGAIKKDFIPNTTILPVLGALLWENENEGNEFFDYLKKWYWASVFSEDYSGSSDSVMAKDFRDWKEWIKNKKDIERIEKIDKEYIYEIDLKRTKKGSSIYNAIMCLLALNNCEDFFEGQIVGTGDYSNEKINDHHIFPKKVKGLNINKSKNFNDYKDMIVNRTLLLDETNSKLTNKKPSDYVEDIIKKHNNEEEVRNIMKGHFIDEVAYEYLKQDDFDNFVEEREKCMKEYIIKKLNL